MNLDRDALFIGGEWTAPASGALLQVVSPHSEEVVATVPRGHDRRYRRRGRRRAPGVRRGTVAAHVAEPSGSPWSRRSPRCTPRAWARWPT